MYILIENFIRLIKNSMEKRRKAIFQEKKKLLTFSKISAVILVIPFCTATLHVFYKHSISSLIFE